MQGMFVGVVKENCKETPLCPGTSGTTPESCSIGGI